jgi:hypothetical protein
MVNTQTHGVRRCKGFYSLFALLPIHGARAGKPQAGTAAFASDASLGSLVGLLSPGVGISPGPERDWFPEPDAGFVSTFDCSFQRLLLAGLKNRASMFVAALAVWLVVTTAVVTVLTRQNPRMRAVLGMGWGLILLWIGVCGPLMVRYRDRVRRVVLGVGLDWRLKFVLMATALALLEEIITTTMTNLAPLFGVRVGEAYITASANYLDVVALHSVVMFVPLFVGWSVILWRYDFKPFAVFLLFGLTGTAMETNLGTKNPMEFGLWIFVYGLMVYLPAYCVPDDRKTRPVCWWHYPLAVVVPFVFIPLVPLPLLAGLLFPNHPHLHFPPIAH